MKKVATSEETQRIDALATSSYGITGLELMENAAKACSQWIKNKYSLILIENHFEYTKSSVAKNILMNWLICNILQKWKMHWMQLQ